MESDKLSAVPEILKRLAQQLGTEISNRRLEIPAQFGKGYCSGFVFNENIRMMISNYELKEDMAVDNPEVNFPGRMIFFKFQNIMPVPENFSTEKAVKATPSVLIATSRLNTEEVVAIHTNVATINIEVDAGYLGQLFEQTEKSAVLQSLLKNSQPLLFEQIVYPSLQKIVEEIVDESIDEAFALFFRRIKAEELVCRLLMELEKRDERQLYALNGRDVEAVYKVKEKLLERLGDPPVIADLAAVAGMSPSKLKRLFRQIFGNSIFSYYQEFRMKEAARLLKEEKLSVSDAGYRMGFTNLSHFARTFQEHLGMKPKQYSRN